MYRKEVVPRTALHADDTVGLEPAPMSRLGPDLPSPPSMSSTPTTGPSAAEITSAGAENQELRAEVATLRAERDRLLETQRRVMELLSSANPDRIVHDLRNVLNERDLFKTLADAQ